MSVGRFARSRLSLAVPALLALAGCAGSMDFGPRPTEADFATIQPGMTSQQILARFGRPTWVFGVRQENLTIWNYRYNRSDCIIYQVSIRPDGSVRDAAPGYDPACDGPSGRD
jgi:outer membrane protein assembly factor BamE (lipoprotein component of BamABCDE complex)